MPYIQHPGFQQDLGALDTTTEEAFTDAANSLADAAIKANPTAKGVLITMGKGGVNQTTTVYPTAQQALDAFETKNNSGAFDNGLLYARWLTTEGWAGTFGPTLSGRHTTTWKSAVPWIIGGTAVIAGFLYFTRNTKTSKKIRARAKSAWRRRVTITTR